MEAGIRIIEFFFKFSQEKQKFCTETLMLEMTLVVIDKYEFEYRLETFLSSLFAFWIVMTLMQRSKPMTCYSHAPLEKRILIETLIKKSKMLILRN